MASKHLVAGLICASLVAAGAAGAQPAEDGAGAADLRTIMRQLGLDMAALHAALWKRDFAALATAATAIAEHPHVSSQEKARVQAVLGAEFASFGAADRRVHDAAVRTAEAATEEDSGRVLSELGSLQAGCVACHDAFWDRLRDTERADDIALRDTPGPDRGAQVFAAYCAVCHGPTGRGDGPAAAALVPPPPDLTGPRPPHLRGIPRRAIIENGSPASAMAAWKGVLSPEDLEAVYGFVHSMHGHRRPGAGPGRGRRGGSSPTSTFTNPERDAIRRAQGAMRALGQTLQQRLMSTMREEGPVEAMSFCATHAQDLTTGVARDEHVAVGRSSLRLRNSENAAPGWVDTWLREQGEGLAASAVDSARIATTADGSKVARALQPLAVGPLCLTCHGAAADLAPQINAALAESYPEDRATGYVIGDLRGAIWAEARVEADRP